jgi:hypothetical protein
MSAAKKKKPGATLAGATGQQNYGASYEFLRRIQRPICALCWAIEQRCARIETKRELRKWNGTEENE